MSRLENIQRPFKSVSQKIKAFSQHPQWKEALVFLAFVLLAFGFWLLQSLQQEYEIEISIPVRYKNVPNDIAFVGIAPTQIIAEVKDKGSVLLNYSFGRTFAPIEVNMKSTQGQSGDLVISKREIENDILKQLIATTTLVEFTPQQIDITYSQRMHKETPVVFDGDIQTEPGFQLSGDILIKPSAVNVYASKTVLDTLTFVRTVPTEIRKGNRTIIRTLGLQKINGANLDPEAVTVTIPIEEYTEKTLEIPVICTGIPIHYTVRLFPPSVKVNCSVPLSRFKELSEDQFAIQIPFKELEQNLSGIIPIRLTQKPEWVRTATLMPDKIEFILEQNKSND